MKIKIDVSASPYLSEAVQKHAKEIGIKSLPSMSETQRSELYPFLLIEENTLWGIGYCSTMAYREQEEISPLDFFKMTKADFEEEIKCYGHSVQFNETGLTIIPLPLDNCLHLAFEKLERIYLKAKSMRQTV